LLNQERKFLGLSPYMGLQL